MKLNFVKLSPSRNTTVLVTEHVSSRNYAEIANKIMSYTYLKAEQVGYITEPKDLEAVIRLEMPGGEFCGDGLMSAAALVRWLEYSKKDEFKLECSGLSSPVRCKIQKIDNYIYRVKCSMPKEHEIIDYETIFEGCKVSGKLVRLPGISHLILESVQQQYSSEFIVKLIQQMASHEDTKAIGIIPYINMDTGIKIEPCIHVPIIGKTLFEQGCGSGTLALGFYLTEKYQESMNVNVNQPGGIINVETIVSGLKREGRVIVESASLQTDILITCSGEVYI